MIRLAALAALAAAAGAAADRPPPPPPGDDAALLTRHCTACHSLDYITTQPPAMGATFWAAEVVKMRAVYGAPIPSDAEDRTIRQLVAMEPPR